MERRCFATPIDIGAKPSELACPTGQAQTAEAF